MIPLMPSPGRPKITSTPQSIKVSIRTSAAVTMVSVQLAHRLRHSVHTKHLFNYILNLSLRTSGAHCNLATQTLYGSKLNQPFTFKPLVRHKHLTDVTPHFKSIWTAADHMADVFLGRLPSLGLAIIVFFLFYG